MNMKISALAFVMAAALPVFVVDQAKAAGFEKNVFWGAREAGVAGIGAPSTTGSKALYFNPAGLVQDEPSHQFSFDISPTWSQFKGPVNYQNEEATSTTSLTTPLGLMYGGAVDSQLGWGIGFYASGGSRAVYEDVPFPGTAAGKANVKTDLAITEVAAGIGYRVNESLKIGAAWRGVMATADVAIASPNPEQQLTANLINLEVNGLKATDFAGFKLGAQYKLSEKTSIGLAYRSEVKLKGDGTYGGKVSHVGVPAPLPIEKTPATGSLIFPMAVNLGIEHQFEKWRALAEYVWTQYSRVDEIVFEQKVTFGGSDRDPVPLKTNWKDQHSVKLGAECQALAWPIRFGYVWTSQVTDAKHARATFSPPGMSHTVTFGTGQDFNVSERPLRFDAALEYTFSSGDSEGAEAGVVATPDGNPTRKGTFKANAYAIHLGVSYAF